jgi:hypothetical protein
MSRIRIAHRFDYNPISRNKQITNHIRYHKITKFDWDKCMNCGYPRFSSSVFQEWTGDCPVLDPGSGSDLSVRGNLASFSFSSRRQILPLGTMKHGIRECLVYSSPDNWILVRLGQMCYSLYWLCDSAFRKSGMTCIIGSGRRSALVWLCIWERYCLP